MEKAKKKISILLAEDDDDDFFLLKDAFKEAGLKAEIQRVKDGEELMCSLLQERDVQNPDSKLFPSLILLDLNMPRKDGREALSEIKAHHALKKIPVVVLTTSRSPEDISKAYETGANAFIRKPIRFEELVQMIKNLERFWFESCELPVLDY